MKKTGIYFTQDSLLDRIHKRMGESLKRYEVLEIKGASISNIDCLMSALSLFTFNFPSLLKFDTARISDKPFLKNLRTLFHIHTVPCDTYMRERLDRITPLVVRSSYTSLFSLLQRHKILEHFRFLRIIISSA